MTDRRTPAHGILGATLRLAALAAAAVPATVMAQDQTDGGQPVRTGRAAFGDWRSDAPGVWRKITPADLPAPFATPSASNTPSVTDRPPGAQLKTLPGFTVQPFVTGLEAPRLLRTAPNGDIFVAESMSGRIRVLRTVDGAAKPAKVETFVEGLNQPFGIAFYPAGSSPQWVYIANTDSIVRIPYRSGDLKARGPAETVVAKLTVSPGGHWTRDIAFSPDDSKMYVSVGSASNLADHMGDKTPADAQAFDADHGLGAAWGPETDRADVLTFTPQGGAPKVYAGGLRNCVALTPNPQTKDLWCAVNERDGLGDNLVPDYATRVKPGGFYGWPWYYMGGVEDPRLKGRRPDLAGKTLTPDVPIQSHSAPLGLVFYPLQQSGAGAFPKAFGGDAFVTLHGSWNRALRTGYKVVRLKLHDGVPTGAYEDFLTGFVINDRKVWGRPVGVAVAHDGALLVSEDGNGTIWRIAYTGPKP